MDKRYQVFISSTFLDLREERQAVSQALLRSDCFPAQMENWPAMDAEQMEAIKQIIDESDYFVVISAGKYGSVNPETGLSYTEMEYDYAMEIGKPIIRLLHRDPFNVLRGDQIESKAGVKKKLATFHAKLKTCSVCSFWENADQLEKETVFALVDIKKRKPEIGWVRADKIAASESIRQLMELREENRLLNQRISNSEPRNFKAMLSGLEGDLSIEYYSNDKPNTDMSDIFDSSFEGFDAVKIKGQVFRKTGMFTPATVSEVLHRVCLGLLLSEDIASALSIGLNNAQSLGDVPLEVYMPHDDHAIVSGFMSLEGSGLVRAGTRYNSIVNMFDNKKSEYLRGTKWLLSDDFRTWLVNQGYKPFAPKTPPQSVP